MLFVQTFLIQRYDTHININHGKKSSFMYQDNKK